MGTRGLLIIKKNDNERGLYNHFDSYDLAYMVFEFLNGLTQDEYNKFLENYEKIIWANESNQLHNSASDTLSDIMEGTCTKLVDDIKFQYSQSCEYIAYLKLDDKTVDGIHYYNIEEKLENNKKSIMSVAKERLNSNETEELEKLLNKLN